MSEINTYLKKRLKLQILLFLLLWMVLPFLEWLVPDIGSAPIVEWEDDAKKTALDHIYGLVELQMTIAISAVAGAFVLIRKYSNDCTLFLWVMLVMAVFAAFLGHLALDRLSILLFYGIDPVDEPVFSNLLIAHYILLAGSLAASLTFLITQEA